MTTKLQPPQLKDEFSEGYDRFVIQFDCYLRMAKPDEGDIFLLGVGEKAAGHYDEVTWPPLTKAEIDAGSTDYSRAVAFLRSKFSAGMNILSERIRLYTSKQQPLQSINDFISQLRLIAKYCDFPEKFSDEAIRDAFCQSILEDSTRKAVWKYFATSHKAGPKGLLPQI